MIMVKNLNFTYPGNNQPTLRNLSFEVPAGTILGFLGPSGAGKSTTQKILIGLLRGYDGTVKLLNEELSEKNREKIGVAFEFPNLYAKFSAVENLKFFAGLYEKKSIDPYELLKQVGLEDSATMKVEEYSKGMRMRLSFCRAIQHNPEVIFLDEPTSGLDPVFAKRIKNIILQQKKAGKTIFLTTHNMHVAEELCDQVAFIHDGKISAIENPSVLKRKYGKESVVAVFQNHHGLESHEFSKNDLGQNESFLSMLKQKELVTIHSQEASLEDIFIVITGRSLQ